MQRDWNFAITILSNRSAVGLLRAGFTWWASDYANASTWVPVGPLPAGASLPDDSNVEDPFLWRDKQGRFHALFHNMEPTDGTAYCGTHAFSSDGANWIAGGWTYGGSVQFTDGSNFTFSRRERPHLLFDGFTPVGLSNGVQYGGPYGDAVFTLVQPIDARTSLQLPPRQHGI